jgi:hypothetical protein
VGDGADGDLKVQFQCHRSVAAVRFFELVSFGWLFTAAVLAENGKFSIGISWMRRGWKGCRCGITESGGLSDDFRGECEC